MKDQSTPVCLFANKIDLEEERKVTQDEFFALKNTYNMSLHETSARTGQGVQELINAICAQVYAQKVPNAGTDGAANSTAANTTESASATTTNQDLRQIDRPSFPLTQKT